MNVYCDSWHYRWIARRWDTLPANLCWYFWKLIFTMIGRLAQAAIIVLIVVIGFVVLVIPIFVAAPMPVAFLASAIWLIIGASALYHYRQHLYRIGRLTRKSKEYKEPNLLSEYIHAKHRKICPLIDYK